MTTKWTGGNRVQLLENGEQFFPAVFGAIERAQHEVLLETFILFQDKVGLALHACLLSAAKRGVHIEVTVDGYGSPDLTADFIGALTVAGVRFHRQPGHNFIVSRFQFKLARLLHRLPVIRKIAGAIALIRRFCMFVFSS